MTSPLIESLDGPTRKQLEKASTGRPAASSTLFKSEKEPSSRVSVRSLIKSTRSAHRATENPNPPQSTPLSPRKVSSTSQSPGRDDLRRSLSAQSPGRNDLRRSLSARGTPSGERSKALLSSPPPEMVASKSSSPRKTGSPGSPASRIAMRSASTGKNCVPAKFSATSLDDRHLETLLDVTNHSNRSESFSQRLQSRKILSSENIVEDAMKAQAEQAESAAHRLLELTEDENEPEPLVPLGPGGVLLSTTSITNPNHPDPRSTHHPLAHSLITKQFHNSTKQDSLWKQFEDSPKEIAIQRGSKNLWWHRQAELSMCAGRQDVSANDVLELVSQIEKNPSTIRSEDRQIYLDLAQACFEYKCSIVNIDDVTGKPSPSQAEISNIQLNLQFWSDQNLFDRLFEALKEKLKQDASVEVKDAQLVLLRALILYEMVLMGGKETELCEVLLLVASEGVSNVRSLWAETSDPVYGLSCLRSCVEIVSQRSRESSMDHQPGTENWMGLAMSCLGGFFARLPAEIVEEELPKASELIKRALNHRQAEIQALITYYLTPKHFPAISIKHENHPGLRVAIQKATSVFSKDFCYDFLQAIVDEPEISDPVGVRLFLNFCLRKPDNLVDSFLDSIDQNLVGSSAESFTENSDTILNEIENFIEFVHGLIEMIDGGEIFKLAYHEIDAWKLAYQLLEPIQRRLFDLAVQDRHHFNNHRNNNNNNNHNNHNSNHHHHHHRNNSNGQNSQSIEPFELSFASDSNSSGFFQAFVTIDKFLKHSLESRILLEPAKLVEDTDQLIERRTELQTFRAMFPSSQNSTLLIKKHGRFGREESTIDQFLESEKFKEFSKLKATMSGGQLTRQPSTRTKKTTNKLENEESNHQGGAIGGGGGGSHSKPNNRNSNQFKASSSSAQLSESTKSKKNSNLSHSKGSPSTVKKNDDSHHLDPFLREGPPPLSSSLAGKSPITRKRIDESESDPDNDDQQQPRKTDKTRSSLKADSITSSNKRQSSAHPSQQESTTSTTTTNNNSTSKRKRQSRTNNSTATTSLENNIKGRKKRKSKSARIEDDADDDGGNQLSGVGITGDNGNPADEEQFVVDKIIGESVDVNGDTIYKVLWAGYPEEEATWQFSNTLDDCAALDVWILEQKERQRLLEDDHLRGGGGGSSSKLDLNSGPANPADLVTSNADI
ncbi:hypothetical protein H4Q26_013347 [Puccinia striiformis f. sp. tritici PST-130]|nr:hypothetical protein H4Q26_013347 [Puccinia striiformis f. sp. tritici PST-130]